MKRTFSLTEARAIGRKIGIDFAKINLGQFRMGLEVELEHGAQDPQTNVTNDNIYITGKIAWAHLKELPDYYNQLAVIENAAETHKGGSI